jgi:hypothetical protein
MAALAVTVVVAAAGCARHGTSTHSAGAPPSTIVAGLEVVRGSHLLGTAFPSARFELDPGPRPTTPPIATAPGAAPTTMTIPDGAGARRWTALAAIEPGVEPASVFDAYAAQLAAAGIALHDLHADAPGGAVGCEEVDDSTTTCLAFTSDPAPVELELTVTQAGRDRTAVIYLQLQLPDDGRFAKAPAAPTVHLRPTRGAAAAPTTAEPLGSRVAPPGSWFLQDIPTVRGFTRIGPSATTDFAGWHAVGRVTGDPDEVARTLVRTPAHEQPLVRHETVAGHRLVEHGWDSAGGDKLWLTAVEDDGTWYGLVQAETDP